MRFYNKIILAGNISLLVVVSILFVYVKPAYSSEGPSAGGSGPPYYLDTDDPEVYRIKLYKAVLVKNDSTEVILYQNDSGTTMDLVNGSFTSLADVNITPGSYTQVKITTSTTFGLKGYILYSGTYYYTKNGSNQSDIGSSSSIPTSLSDYGTQTTTITDPGSGTVVGPTMGSDPTFIYTSNITLSIGAGERPKIRAEILANDYLELNDSTVNTIDNGTPAQITFGAPTIDVSGIGD